MSDKNSNLPQHVGLILDGNRRWAKERGLKPMDGHKAGFETFKKISEHGLERGIKYLSVYAFSTENWKRSKEEVGFLLNFVQLVIEKHIKELDEKNVRFIWLGSEEGLEKGLIKKLRKAEEISKDNTRATFCLCFNYGGQQEIVDAIKNLHAKDKEVSIDSIGDSLYGGADVPPIDLVIRTSGEKRLSNFMLWRSAYSELFFSDKMWPDFTEADLDDAIEDYADRCRRFGN